MRKNELIEDFLKGYEEELRKQSDDELIGESCLEELRQKQIEKLIEIREENIKALVTQKRQALEAATDDDWSDYMAARELRMKWNDVDDIGYYRLSLNNGGGFFIRKSDNFGFDDLPEWAYGRYGCDGEESDIFGRADTLNEARRLCEKWICGYAWAYLYKQHTTEAKRNLLDYLRQHHPQISHINIRYNGSDVNEIERFDAATKPVEVTDEKLDDLTDKLVCAVTSIRSGGEGEIHVCVPTHSECEDDEDIAPSIVPPLRPGKIKKQLDWMEALADQDGKDDKGEEVIPPVALTYLIAGHRAILKGEEDIGKVLARQRKVLEGRAAPV